MRPASARSANVILLNGTSSAGKSTLARAIQDAMDEPYLHTGLDHFLRRYPRRFMGEVDGWDDALRDGRLVALPRVPSAPTRTLPGCMAPWQSTGGPPPGAQRAGERLRSRHELRDTAPLRQQARGQLHRDGIRQVLPGDACLEPAKRVTRTRREAIVRDTPRKRLGNCVTWMPRSAAPSSTHWGSDRGSV